MCIDIVLNLGLLLPNPLYPRNKKKLDYIVRHFHTFAIIIRPGVPRIRLTAPAIVLAGKHPCPQFKDSSASQFIAFEIETCRAGDVQLPGPFRDEYTR